MKQTRQRGSNITWIVLIAILITGGARAQMDVDQPLAKTTINTPVHQLAWNPDGRSLAVASDAGLLVYSNDLQILEQRYSDTIIYSASWSPDGDQLAVTHGQSINIWDWDGEKLTPDRTLEGNQTQLLVAWSPDGAYLASADGSEGESGWTTTIRFWDTSTWQLQATTPETYFILKGFPFANQMMWNPTGVLELVMIGDTAVFQDGQYLVDTVENFNFIDATTGHLIRALPYNSFSTAAAWHPQGEWIARGREMGVVLHNIIANDFKPALGVHGEFDISFYRTYAMDWANAGRYLAINDAIYDFEQDRYLGDFNISGSLPDTIDWHPDNTRLATADSSGHIRVEDASLFNHFVPPHQAATSFMLVDADADEDLRPLEDGDIITEETITIRVGTEPPIVGSVVFGLDDEPRFKVENEAAYALKGDDNGDYHAWLAEPGTYTLTATPYTEADGGGEAGTPLTITFTVEAPGS